MAAYHLLKPVDEVAVQLETKARELKEFERRCESYGATDSIRDALSKWKESMEIQLTSIVSDGPAAWNALQVPRGKASRYPIFPGENEMMLAEIKSYSINLATLIDSVPRRKVVEPVEVRRPPKKTTKTLVRSPIKIFISHSSKDEAFAEAIVALLEGSLQFREKELRCTSVNGYKLKPGDNSADTLRAEIQSCDVLIALLTPDALMSGFVLMEFGAAWGLKKPVCPILAPSLNWSSLPGPFAAIHGVKADDRNGLVSVVEMVREATDFEQRSPQKRDACLTNTLATLKTLFP